MKTALSVLVRAPRPIGLVGGQSVGGVSLRTSFLVSCECRKLIGPFSEAVGVRVQDFEEDVLLGEPGRTRTYNPLIKSQLLYH
jgi:hypothetical protein